jgi:hypothetical protein
MTLLPAIPAPNDEYYFGCSHKFNGITIVQSTTGNGVWTITWQYYNGIGAWASLSGVVDGGGGFRPGASPSTYNVTFTEPDDWATTAILGVSNTYWIRASVSAYTSIVAQPLGQRAYIMEHPEKHYKTRIITDDIGKDDSGKDADASYPMASLAAAELFRSSRSPLTCQIVIPGKPEMLAGQIAHIHGQESGGAYGVNRDMRILSIRHSLTRVAYLNYLTLTSDLYNGVSLAPRSQFDLLLEMVTPESQNRQISSIKSRIIDITTGFTPASASLKILEKKYTFNTDYPIV